MESNPRGNKRYKTWFGDFDIANFNAVQDNFQAMWYDPLGFDGITFDCAPTVCKEGWYAYTEPEK